MRNVPLSEEPPRRGRPKNTSSLTTGSSGTTGTAGRSGKIGRPPKKFREPAVAVRRSPRSHAQTDVVATSRDEQTDDCLLYTSPSPRD